MGSLHVQVWALYNFKISKHVQMTCLVVCVICLYSCIDYVEDSGNLLPCDATLGSMHTYRHCSP